MTAVTFDTLEFVETLKEAGISEAQAKAISVAVRHSQEAVEIATKADLRAYDSALRHEISDLRKDMDAKFVDMKAEMSNMKFELLKWIIGLALAQFGLLTGVLIKLILLSSGLH